MPSHSHNLQKRSDELFIQGGVHCTEGGYCCTMSLRTIGYGGNQWAYTGSFKGSSSTLNNEPQYYALAFYYEVITVLLFPEKVETLYG